MPYRAQSELEAANLALGTIGEPPIGSFTDNNARARKINMWFGTVRDAVQRDHDFGFCSAYCIPAMDPTPALGKLKNRFVMPDDCLKVRDVRPYKPSTAPNYGGISITDPNVIAQLEALNSQPVGDREWDMEAAAVNPGDPPPAAMVMVTNIAQPVVNYTRRITIVRLWDALFLEAFVPELGAAVAPAIARDINAADKKKAEAGEMMDDAARTDSREQSPKHVSKETLWVRSRFIGYGYRGGRY
jgi:hypothetical protein